MTRGGGEGAYPFSDRAIPPNDAGTQPGVSMHFAAPKESRILYPNTVLDNDTGSNDHVWADHAVGVDFRRGVLK